MTQTRWMGWAIAGAVAGAVLLAGMLAAFVLFGVRWHLPPTLAPTSTVITQIQAVHELVTVKYVVEKIVKLESEPSVLGEDRVVLLVHAIAKAGVDLSSIRPEDIRVHDKSVTLTLPPPKVTDCYIEDRKTEVWEHQTRFWRPLDQELEQKARRQALDQIRLAVRDQGIHKEAFQRACQQLTLLLRSLGFEEVEIVQRSL